MAAIDIANAINTGFQPAFAEPFHQPMAAFHILRRKGWAMNARFIGADFAQIMKIGKETLSIDLHHGGNLWLRNFTFD
jgi:hypothetical protein